MPKAAKSYVRQLRKSVNILRDFPEIGAVVEEFDDPTIREIEFDVYRIVYRYVEKVSILIVHPGAQPLNARHLFGE